MNRIWLAIAACLWLGGCGTGTRPAFPHHYTLAAPAPAATPSRQEPGLGTLHVARIDAPPWLQDNGLHYRLAYRHDDRIAAYAQSDWVAPPGQMLGALVRRGLAAGTAWRVVTGPGNPAAADASLHLRLDDFSQVFTGPARSFGVLDATATLVDESDGHAIAQKHFHVRAAAPGADAPGGVEALNRASRTFAARLRQWLRAVQPAGATAPGNPRAPGRVPGT